MTMLLMVSHCLLFVNDYEKTQHLLEKACTQANSLDLAQKNGDSYVQPIVHVATVTPFLASDDNTSPCSEAPDASALVTVCPKRTCYFCGGAPHNRLKFPARESVCHNCEIKGHRFCMSKKKPGKNSGNVDTMYSPTLCALSVTELPSQIVCHMRHYH